MRYLILIFLIFFAFPVSAATVTKTIGTASRDYSTITLWQADLDDGTNAANDATAYSSGDDAVGEMYDDSAFNEAFSVSGGGVVGLTSVTLTVASGERHDGTAGTGARIVRTSSSLILIEWGSNNGVIYNLEWLEIDSNAQDTRYEIQHQAGTIGTMSKLIVHGADKSRSSDNQVIRIEGGDSGDVFNVLNCIIYDVFNDSTGETHGIRSDSSSNTRTRNIINNTIHNVSGDNGSAVIKGLLVKDNSGQTMQNNIVTDTSGATSEDYDTTSYSSATVTNNLSSDTTASGTGSLISKSSANQYVSTSIGSEDLHLKAGADAIDAGIDKGTSPTGVNFDIDNRDRDAEGDTWDMGADEFVVAGGSKSDIPYALSIESGNKALFEFISSGTTYSATSTTSINDNEWHHITATYDGSSIKMYVEGVLEDTNTDPSGNLSTNDGNVRIGADYQATPANFFDGLIDDARIYDRALSAGEVKRLYELGGTTHVNVTLKTNPDLENGLVGHWTFDGKDVNKETNVITDSSGQGNHGSTVGMDTATTTAIGVLGQAFEFDGTDDYVDIGAGPASVNSVAFWVYPETTTEYFVNLTSTTDYIWVSGGTVTATGFTSPTIYVDGVVSSTLVADQWQYVVVTTATSENASNLDVGRTADTNYMEGKIDDARMYNRALSAGEVKRLYDMGR